MTNTTITMTAGGFNKVSANHNLRKGEFRNKEHIDPNGKYRIWEHTDLNKFYNEIFADAIKKYNQKQIDNKHSERQIKNYFDYVKNSNAKSRPQLCYEIVVSIGNKNVDITEPQSYNILKQYYLEFKAKFPNLKVVGCYYHADEQGQPHIHLDYVPVAGLKEPYKKGLEIQNSLTKACHEMGIQHQRGTTEQILLQEQQRDLLKNICAEYGFNVVSADELNEQRKIIKTHLDPEQYKAVQNVIENIEDYYKDYVHYLLNDNDKELNKIKNKIQKLSNEIDDIYNELDKQQQRNLNNDFQDIIKAIADQYNKDDISLPQFFDFDDEPEL